MSGSTGELEIETKESNREVIPCAVQSPPKTRKHESNVPANFSYPTPGTLFVCGPRASGKTVFIQKLLHHWRQQGAYNKLYVHCPKETREEYFECCLNAEIMPDSLTRCFSNADKNPKPNVIVIENVQTIKASEFDELCNNARHYNVSVIVSSQYVNHRFIFDRYALFGSRCESYLPSIHRNWRSKATFPRSECRQLQSYHYVMRVHAQWSMKPPLQGYSCRNETDDESYLSALKHYVLLPREVLSFLPRHVCCLPPPQSELEVLKNALLILFSQNAPTRWLNFLLTLIRSYLYCEGDKLYFSSAGPEGGCSSLSLETHSAQGNKSESES